MAFKDSDPLEEVTLPAWSVIGTFQDRQHHLGDGVVLDMPPVLPSQDALGPRIQLTIPFIERWPAEREHRSISTAPAVKTAC